MDKVIIYTDGACSGNPGVGGWGAILMYNNVKKELHGGALLTTNNQMELTAVIEALSILKRKCNIDIYTDSKYVMDGITQWIDNWKKNNWKTSKKQNVLNRDLWEKLDNLRLQHSINWYWVKGHNNDEFNERADELARCGIKELKNKD